MKIATHLVPSLPRMSWCAKITRGSPVVRVFHGQWVDARPNFVFEGAWSGAFESGPSEESTTIFGSGLISRDDSIVLLSPTHTSEAIYTFESADSVYASNSIAFILKQANEELDPSFRDYEHVALSISKGIDNYNKSIPLKSGKSISCHYYSYLIIRSDLSLSEHLYSAKGDGFNSFGDYKSHLLTEMQALQTCAMSRSRAKQFPFIAACSRGYDSAAASALGRALGCQDAIVVETKHKIRSDSGRPVVSAMGYSTIIEYNELDYLRFPVTADFMGTGEIAMGLYLAPAERYLEGRMLLAGTHGDRVWDLNLASNQNIVRSVFPSTAKKEFRLRVGYIEAPIPFISVLHQENIHKISNSAEMEPWRIGGSYDRPVPRRIAEEMGARREDFGFHKVGGAGTSLRVAGLGRLRRTMNSQDFASFSEFYRKNGRVPPLVRSFAYASYCAYIIARMNKIPLPDGLERLLPENWTNSPWAPSWLFLWGIETLSPRYDVGVEQPMVAGEAPSLDLVAQDV